MIKQELKNRENVKLMTVQHRDDYWIAQALQLAKQAELQGEVPVAAILTRQDQQVAEGYNQPITHNDPTAHAEIVALRQGAKALNNYRLLDTTLYVTLEPCAMCVGAMLHARIKRLVFGASDSRVGAVTSVFHLLDEPSLNHRIEWCGGVMAAECGDLLKQFFRKRR